MPIVLLGDGGGGATTTMACFGKSPFHGATVIAYAALPLALAAAPQSTTTFSSSHPSLGKASLSLRTHKIPCKKKKAPVLAGGRKKDI